MLTVASVTQRVKTMNKTDEIEVCQVTSQCDYGSYASGPCCGFIEKTGRSRVKDDPKGRIVNGRCGYFKERGYERTRARAKDRWDSTFPRREMP